jgi:hypothetical protein
VNKYPCPCCGYLMFYEGPGSYDICKICFWEDDLSQLRFVEWAASKPIQGKKRKSITTIGGHDCSS